MFNATIQILLSQKENISSEFFSGFPEPTFNLEYFEKKDEPQKLFVSEIIDFNNQCYSNAKKTPCQKTYQQ